MELLHRDSCVPSSEHILSMFKYISSTALLKQTAHQAANLLLDPHKSDLLIVSKYSQYESS